jgi:hypothetical protein
MVSLFYISLIVIRILFIYAITGLVFAFVLRHTRLNKWKFAILPIFNIKFLLALIVLLFILGHVRWAFFSSHMEWNPTFIKEDIVGTWGKGDTYLTFDPNGTMYCYGECDVYLENRKYFWDIAEASSNIVTRDIKGEIVWAYHLITFFGDYRMYDDPHNMDNTASNLGFSKAEPLK